MNRGPDQNLATLTVLVRKVAAVTQFRRHQPRSRAYDQKPTHRHAPMLRHPPSRGEIGHVRPLPPDPNQTGLYRHVVRNSRQAVQHHFLDAPRPTISDNPSGTFGSQRQNAVSATLSAPKPRCLSPRSLPPTG